MLFSPPRFDDYRLALEAITFGVCEFWIIVSRSLTAVLWVFSPGWQFPLDLFNVEENDFFKPPSGFTSPTPSCEFFRRICTSERNIYLVESCAFW
jgi:hypothetical protein